MSGYNPFDSFYEKSQQNKASIDSGKPVIIPFLNFPKLSGFIPGIVKSEHIVITGSTGSGGKIKVES